MKGLCLVNGAPGVGKSTICGLLSQGFEGRYAHVSFGGLIRDALAVQGVAVEEPQLRREVTALVDASVLAAATDLLVERVRAAESDSADWILVDSHAVSPDWYGYIAAPDGDEYFAKLRYAAIIHLFASEELILARSDQTSTGRRCETPAQVRMLSRLLESVTLGYSSRSHCPAYFISADGEARDVAQTIDKILT